MKMNSRMIMRIVAAVVLAAVLGWQWWGKHHAGNTGTNADATSGPVSAATVAAKPVKPVPPATMKMGQLTLTACELKPPHTSKGVPAFCQAR